MGCGGACGGNCSCSRPSDPRRFGLKANDANILVAVRTLMLEDPAGIAVILTEQEFKRMKQDFIDLQRVAEQLAVGKVRPVGGTTDVCR